MLVATGGSAPSPAALTDGKLDTAWSEQRPGDGHGEFVTMRAPSELPIHSLVVTIAPGKPKPEGAAPRTFFVAMDDRLLQVTMPEDAWQKPEQAYDIPLPTPVRTTCVAVVLDEAYARGAAAPEVSIAELVGDHQVRRRRREARGRRARARLTARRGGGRAPAARRKRRASRPS